MTIERPTLARQAYAEIQNKILSGELAAGQRLLPDVLASALAVSQTPVKEALALLERDGLVTGTDRRASSVRRFTPQDVLEIYEARILLEVNAITTALDRGRIDPGFIGKLEEIAAAQVALFPPATKDVLVQIIALDRVAPLDPAAAADRAHLLARQLRPGAFAPRAWADPGRAEGGRPGRHRFGPARPPRFQPRRPGPPPPGRAAAPPVDDHLPGGRMALAALADG
jgi:DNA-binding transcriptional regulator YhcF (GntR family)